MIKIIDKSKCCGCHACENICPKSCINMIADEEGFLYPKVNKNKCVECKLCERVCPIINSVDNNEFKSIAYACRNKNEEVRISSSSGGIFFLLCEEVINRNGVVFGAAFDDNFNVKHNFAQTLEECKAFRGSKYVQSSIGDMYKKAKEFLDKGRTVLFTGTQCQIKGLKVFLGENYNNLLTVDVICHGVPSTKVFNVYKEELIKKYNSPINTITFRDKVKGWNKFSCTINFKSGQQYSKTLREDNFMKAFLNNLDLRPSCYDCSAKKFTSGSDVSLADYWGVENIHPKIDDDKGISLLLVNSKKGYKCIGEILDKVDILETNMQFAVKNNPCIVESVKYNKKREEFFKYINKMTLEKSLEKCFKLGFTGKVKNKISYEISKLKFKE